MTGKDVFSLKETGEMIGIDTGGEATDRSVVLQIKGSIYNNLFHLCTEDLKKLDYFIHVKDGVATVKFRNLWSALVMTDLISIDKKVGDTYKDEKGSYELKNGTLVIKPTKPTEVLKVNL